MVVLFWSYKNTIDTLNDGYGMRGAKGEVIWFYGAGSALSYGGS